MAGLWDTHSHGQQPNSTWHWTLPTARFSQTTFQPSRVALVGWLCKNLPLGCCKAKSASHPPCCNIVYLQKQRSTFFILSNNLGAVHSCSCNIFPNKRSSTSSCRQMHDGEKRCLGTKPHVPYYSPTKPALHSFKAKKGTVTLADISERAQNSSWPD